MAGILKLAATLSPFPYAAAAIASYTGKAELTFEEGASLSLDLHGSTISAEDEIVQALAKEGGLSDDSAKTQAYFALAKSLPTVTSFPDIVAALDSLDDHLAFRTYLVGHGISAADWILWGALKGSVKIVGLLKNNKHRHLLRWYTQLESLESTQLVIASLAEARSTKARSNKTAASFALGLEGAEMGKVVTRFPPEPSGYLHIGHAKAAMLNQYFAQMYQGKLLIRFDDTNPTKERTEFEDTILEDLALLDVRGDAVSHTSDFFDQLYELAIKMIKEGKAYADDTEQMEMRQQRFDGIASRHRDDSVEDNLAHFAEMKTGSAEGVRWCIRAKMSVDNPNKALRDPVVYRCNLLPHHRTGDKWKIYPTYDFACPIVDSLEGVTHALRTNEYRDRNPQYYWMIEALNLRPVRIWDFSRLNFIYTLLSKRKLHWFVDQGIVHGWDDPRFPTVRGIRRRGLTVEALRQFMLAQGPSQAIVSLEWDSLWTLNKKIIDPIAPRFWAISTNGMVKVTVNGGPSEPEVKSLPKHKKNPEVGEKQTVFSSNILVEQEDALSFDDNEEITLMDWGNAIVRSKTTNAEGVITQLTMDLHLAGDFRKTKKKITWLSDPAAQHALVETTLLDYDYLITKKKLEDEDAIQDFVTPQSEFREAALADANVRALRKGDIIQFERKGYYIFDGVAEGAGRWEFIRIPDGRAASIASKAAPVANAPGKAAKEEKELVEKGGRGSGAGAGAGGDFVKRSLDIPVDTKMYQIDPIYGMGELETPADTKMYKVKSVYDS